jgi:hypothetical protein
MGDLGGYYESVKLNNGRASVSLDRLQNSRGASFDRTSMRPLAIAIELYSSTNLATDFDFCMTALSLE